jgi:hypothetical protein
MSTGFGVPKLLAIRPDGQGDVTRTHVAWSTQKHVPHTPSVLLVGDELYMVSDRGVASCLSAETGKVHWQKRIAGNYSASPIYAKGRIYFLSEEGTATVIKASKEFKRLAKNVLGERALASFAVADGALFVRTERGSIGFRSKGLKNVIRGAGRGLSMGSRGPFLTREAKISATRWNERFADDQKTAIGEGCALGVAPPRGLSRSNQARISQVIPTVCAGQRG